MVRFSTYNIRNRRNGGLEFDISELTKEKVDVVVMQETKLIDGVYTRESSGFWVMATEAPSAHCGGVAIFYCKTEHFATKELRLYGPDVIRFQLVTGRRR